METNKVFIVFSIQELRGKNISKIFYDKEKAKKHKEKLDKLLDKDYKKWGVNFTTIEEFEVNK